MNKKVKSHLYQSEFTGNSSSSQLSVLRWNTE